MIPHVFNLKEDNSLYDVAEIVEQTDGIVEYSLLCWDFDTNMWFPPSLPLNITRNTRLLFVRTLPAGHLMGFGTTLHVAQDIPDPLSPKEALAKATNWRKLIAQRPLIPDAITVVFYWKVRHTA